MSLERAIVEHRNTGPHQPTPAQHLRSLCLPFVMMQLVGDLLSRGVGHGLMKRAQRGLYGGKRIMFGNTISHSERRFHATLSLKHHPFLSITSTAHIISNINNLWKCEVLRPFYLGRPKNNLCTFSTFEITHCTQPYTHIYPNIVPHHRHRRSWKPNVQMIQFYSGLLETNIRFKMTTFVLRQVDKMGGIDRYLLYTPNEKIASELGIKLKLMLMNAFETKHGKKFDFRDKSLILPLGTYVRPITGTPSLSSTPSLSNISLK